MKQPVQMRSCALLPQQWKFNHASSQLCDRESCLAHEVICTECVMLPDFEQEDGLLRLSNRKVRRLVPYWRRGLIALLRSERARLSVQPPWHSVRQQTETASQRQRHQFKAREIGPKEATSAGKGSCSLAHCAVVLVPTHM